MGVFRKRKKIKRQSFRIFLMIKLANQESCFKIYLGLLNWQNVIKFDLILFLDVLKEALEKIFIE